MDPEDLGRLIDQHAQALELYAKQWCELPEDVVQEAFVKLSMQASPPNDPPSWLFRVVRNASINASVAARRRRRHETIAAKPSDWFESDRDSSAAVLIDPASAEAELRALPIDQREVIVARLWGGLSFEQIASLANCSSSSVHRLYHSGLKALRERLGVPCHTNKTPQSQG